MVYHILLDDSNIGTGENTRPSIYRTCKTLSELKLHLDFFHYHYTVDVSPEIETRLAESSVMSEEWWDAYHQKYKITQSSPEKDSYIDRVIVQVKDENNRNKIISCDKLSANLSCCYAFIVKAGKQFVIDRENLKIMFPLSHASHKSDSPSRS